MASRTAHPAPPVEAPRPAVPPRPAGAAAKHVNLRLVVDRTTAPAKPAGPAPRPMAALSPPPARGPGSARGPADWVWSGLGLGAATASAGFAAYMLAFSPGTVTPSGNFNLFVHYDRRTRPPAARTEVADATPAPGAPAVDRASAPTETAEVDAVDFTPTGTVSAAARTSQRDADAGASGRGTYSPNSSPLPNFTLRNVFDGKALVESRSSLSVVKPGSMLDGAGQVLSIERRGGSWVVLTDRGLIAGRQ